MATFNPIPQLGGANWSGNQSVATLRQLLSTSQGLANNGDSNLDVANISTLYVSTITGFYNGTQPINIQNTSSINISTFRNININGSNITLKSQNIGQILNNGIMTIDNKDPVTGTRTANTTNILTGDGSFQALYGNLLLAGSDILDVYAGTKIQLETASSQNNLPTGIIDASINNLINVRSLSSINISTGVIKGGDTLFDSVSTAQINGGGYLGSLFIGTNSGSDLYLNSRYAIRNTAVGPAGEFIIDATKTSIGWGSGGINFNGSPYPPINPNASFTSVTATTGSFTNISGSLTGNVYNTNLTLGAKYSITETADVGSAIADYGSYGTVNISGKGGLGGIVNITADVATPNNPAITTSQLTMEAKGNYGLITPGSPIGYIPRGGLVSITARQGLTPSPPAEVTSALFANGEIDLTAYSYGVVPGLIKLSAGANSMYAGPVTPITGLFGNNYIYGTVANTMIAGLPPGGVPTFVGTNYLYGYNGTSINNSLYVDNILNYGNGVTYSNLTISANNSKDVIITNVKTLNMQNNPTIDGAGTGSINSFSNINGSNLNIYKQAYISSLTVDDIVWTNKLENFDNLYTSTLYTSTITGFANGTQTLNLLNTSSIIVSTGRLLQNIGSNVTCYAQNTFATSSSNISMTATDTTTLDNRGTTKGLTSILASTLSFYAQNNALLSANTNDLNLYSGLSTIVTAGTSVYLNTPKVQVKTHIDTPSISTINFQATNFQATTTSIANETIAGTLTAPTISTTTINNIGTGVPITVNAPSLNTTTINTTTTNAITAQISTLNTCLINGIGPGNGGGQALSVSTTTININATGDPPVVVPVAFTFTGANQTWVVPAGVTSVQVTLNGAGGGGNTSGTYSTPGRGGLVSGTLAVTPGESLNIIVGEGGRTYPGGTAFPGFTRFGGGGSGYNGGCDGGGRSAIQRGGVDIVTAGGGGGAAAISGVTTNNGGDGGGLTGGNGGGANSSGSPLTGGPGGSQTAGGVAPTGPSTDGANGVAGRGGDYGYSIPGGGAGGGGWFGGAGGGMDNPDASSAGGGGGGSSYVAGLTGTVVNTQGGGAGVTRNGSVTIYVSGVVGPAINISTNALCLTGNLRTNVVTSGTSYTNRRIRIMTVDTGGGDFWDSTGLFYANTTGVANYTNSDSPTGGFEYACYDAVFSLAGFDGTLDAFNLNLTQCVVTGAVNGSGNWYAACQAKAMPGVVGPPPTLHTKWFVTGLFIPKTFGNN